MVYNKIHVAFGALRKINGPPLQWQYNEKQILVISGLDLPEFYSVDFMNKGDADTITMPKTDNGIEIPDQFLLTGKPLIAYIVVVDGESVNTIGQITFPVNVRGRRTDISPTPAEQQQIDALVDALNSGVTRAETAAETAEQAVVAVQEAVERSETAADDAETSANNAAESATNAANSAGVATTKANQAASSAQSASQDASAANASAGSAAQAAASARESASAAAGSASNAASSANSASGSAGQAAASASAAAGSASQAAGSAQSASGSATSASQSATNAATKAQEAASKATEAGNAKDAAVTAKNDAVTAKNAAETAQGKAEDAQAAAEEAAESIEESAAQIAQNTQDISDLNSVVNDPVTGLDAKAPVIVNSTSGDVVSFSDGADSMPIRKLVGTIEPVQDLHGYDHPWPAGGGANKWDEVTELGSINDDGEFVPATSRLRSKNLTEISPSTAYYLVTPIACVLFYYDENSTFISNEIVNAGSFTTPENAKYLAFYMSTGYGTTYKNNIAVNYPATITTYSPYENICPISGWTGAEITRTGQNVLGGTALEENILNNINGTTSTITVDSAEHTVRIPAQNYPLVFITYPFKENTQYSFVYTGYGSSDGRQNFTLVHTDGTALSVSRFGDTNVHTGVLVSTPGKTVAGIRQNNNGGAFYMDTLNTGIFEGVLTESDFVLYTGTTLHINWQNEAGTIYGGSFTLNEDGSVDVVAKREKAILNGNETYQIRSSGTIQALWNVYDATHPDFYYAPSVVAICNYLGQSEAWDAPNGCCSVRNSGAWSYVNFRQDDYFGTTPEEAQSKIAELFNAGTPFEVVYDIRTPKSFHFADIGSLLTYYGQNNVWIDTGSISECDYPADTKLFLTARDEEITQSIAPIENGTTASKPYAQGEYFFHNTKFCKAKTAIASGATFTLNTNYTETTVAAELIAAQ